DSKQSKYVKQKGILYTADNNGYFKIKERTDKTYNYSYTLEISHGGEKFFPSELLNDYYYNNYNTEVSKQKTSVFLFTDRSIYRPGQTVYFKGITVLKGDNNNSIVNDKYSSYIYLKDANDQIADSVKITTNEYGSFSATFQLPQSLLNGDFKLQMKADNGMAGIKVEEYKRPKFFVDYEPLNGTYKVNDEITITGNAKAYAGNYIDGASVTYRVVRQARFIYPWLWRKWWLPPSEEMEIAHGEAKTDKDGKFTIKFTAIPDLKTDKKFDPVFDYTVYADVTDINGETRSGEKTVSVSYKALMMKTDIPTRLPADSLKSLSIKTENMNGEHAPSKVNVTIIKLKEEKRLIRDRFWSRPDQFVMTKQEYISYFPHDEYDNEANTESWEKEQQVFSRNDSTTENGEWLITNGKFSPGFYQIEIVTKDKNGEEVKDVQFIELYDEQSSQLNHPEYLWTSTKNETPEPGEKMSVKLGTAADDLFIVEELSKQPGGNDQQATTKYSFIKLNNEKKNFDYPATEADRGGFGVSYLFVKHNRFHQVQQTANVPWSNKDLKIEYTTFRDKTLPGSEEKWKVKISGFKKEKVAAEMLASMYDASLDQFYPHYWSQPSVWPVYYKQINWNGSNNFTKIESEQKWIPNEQKYFYKAYDQLITNYNAGYYQVGYGRGAEMKRALSGKVPRLAAAPSLQKNQSDGLDEVVVAASRSANTIYDGLINLKGVDLHASSLTFKNSNQDPEVRIRKNFNETAFFLPDLKTNENGDIEFSFTIPEALTKWKFQALAHTKDLAFGYSSKEIVTQKDLMVQPNAPRFLREGDKIEFSTKIVNLTDKEITGQARLQLFDAATNEPVDGRFRSVTANQYFTVGAGQSEVAMFPMEIPYQFNKALVWRITATTENKSDAEENILPILTNRMLVTETMPITMHGDGTKEFKFDKLLNSGSSNSLQQHSLTVEYTSNPVWYAVQALPYLMEYPYECAEQTFNRYYANALASHITNSTAKIKAIFETWKTQ
ncbi:MAG: alpha-2-macroglobulin family protein, partial [Ginsengibacter sp.]